MRVCLLTPEFLPSWGGVGTYTYNLARGLRDRAEIHVLTGAAPPEADADKGLRVHRLPSTGNGGSPVRFQASVFRRLPRLVREEGIDIVHTNHAYMSDLLARLRSYPGETVVTVHTTLDTQSAGTRRAGPGAPRRGLERTIARWRVLLRAVERRYLRRTSSMIFVSHWVRERTLRRYRVAPRNDAVVPNAVDASLFAPRCDRPENGHPPTVLFAGRLLALKGIETLLHAASRAGTDFRLVLAGPGDPGPWRKMATELGLGEDRCRFLGRVPYPGMPDLYRSASAVVLPSYTESCPLVALEAMASGVPLIAADAGGVPEIVRDGETGWLFPPGNADALAAKLGAVLGDPGAAEAVSARASAWVRGNASIDRMAADTYRFYGQVLEGAAS